MTHHVSVFKVYAEIILVTGIGFVIAMISGWWDPDSVIAFYWLPVLVLAGVLFGLFGRCPVLVIGPVMAWSGVLMEVFDLFQYGFSAWFLKFYMLYFMFMAIVVIVGAAIGRGVKRFFIHRRLKHAA